MECRRVWGRIIQVGSALFNQARTVFHTQQLEEARWNFDRFALVSERGARVENHAVFACLFARSRRSQGRAQFELPVAVAAAPVRHPLNTGSREAALQLDLGLT